MMPANRARFRPLQESIDICTKMLLQATYYGDEAEIEYWTKRRNGYAKLASQKGIQVQMTKIEIESE